MSGEQAPGPPDFWAHLGEGASPAEIAAADEAHDAWMASPAGQAFLAWDQEVVARANRRGVSYREAMEARDER